MIKSKQVILREKIKSKDCNRFIVLKTTLNPEGGLVLNEDFRLLQEELQQKNKEAKIKYRENLSKPIGNKMAGVSLEDVEPMPLK
jgi:hypothetical protein